MDDGWRFVPADALEWGWDKATDHFGFFFKALLLAGIVQTIPLALAYFGIKYLPLGIVLIVMYIFTGGLFALGFTNVILKVGRGEKPRLLDLVSMIRIYPKYLLSSFVVGIFIFLGYLLFIAPGVILSIRFLFYGFVMVETDAGPIECIKESWRITRYAFWHLLMLGIGCAFTCAIGFLFCGVGLFLALPCALMAVVYAFQHLMYGETESEG